MGTHTTTGRFGGHTVAGLPSAQLREIHPPRVAERATLPVQSTSSRSGWRTPQDRAEGWALVSAVQAGDREAWGRLFQRYERQVREYLCRRLGDHAVADDLTSETFMHAMRRIDGVRDQGKDFLGFLLFCAKNVVWDHRQRAYLRREVALEQLPEDSEPATATATAYGSPEEEVLRRIDQAAIESFLRSGLEQLSVSRRRCVQLYDLEERSMNEVMELLGSTEVAIRSTRLRARRQLAGILDPNGEPGTCRYAAVLDRARSAYERRAREPKPEPLTPAQTALRQCRTKGEALLVAWRFLGVTAVPDTSDIAPALDWLANHGVTLSSSMAYRASRKLAHAAAEQAGGFNHAETEGMAA